MQFYLLTPVFAVILTVCLIGGLRWVVLVVAASLPFGRAAVIGLPTVAGLSLLAVNVAVLALVGGGCLILVSRLVRRRSVLIEPSTLALVLFAAYSIFSATVLVRLFEGETMVFSLARGVEGVKVSSMFSWGKVWLGPSNSNISQTFYVMLACGFFVIATHVLSRHGKELGTYCLVLAASLNLALGLMDLTALDPILSVVRTANYSLANEATVQGIPRVIGGYSEAASFGSASAMFFGFFASAYSYSGRLRDAVLALGNGVFALLALSSTGIIGIAVVCAVLTPRIVTRIPALIRRTRLIFGALFLGAMALSIAALLVFTPAPDQVTSVIQDLILNKSQSSSGLERTAWAMGGLEALRDTWGLGAGTGSLRSNGLAFVLLGSVGVIGTAAFTAFLWIAFSGRAAPGQAATLSNTRVATLALLVSMLTTATVPDPGVPLILLAAIAVSSKRQQRSLAGGHRADRFTVVSDPVVPTNSSTFGQR
jgi:hypothetical protein